MKMKYLISFLLFCPAILSSFSQGEEPQESIPDTTTWTGEYVIHLENEANGKVLYVSVGTNVAIKAEGKRTRGTISDIRPGSITIGTTTYLQEEIRKIWVRTTGTKGAGGGTIALGIGTIGFGFIIGVPIITSASSWGMMAYFGVIMGLMAITAGIVAGVIVISSGVAILVLGKPLNVTKKWHLSIVPMTIPAAGSS